MAVLGPKDHTNIMNFMLKNLITIALVYIPKGPLKKELDAVDILQALLKVDDIDKHMESTIKEAIFEIKKLDNTEFKIPDDVNKVIKEIEKKLDATDSVNEMIKLLQEMKKNGQYVKHPGIGIGIDVANSILQDGLSTIYSSESPYSVMYSVKGVAKKDIAGAVVGAAVGAGQAATPGGSGNVGQGAAIGGTAGAIGASAGGAVKGVLKKIWDWLSDLF